MRSGQSSGRSSTEHWPTFDLTYTFNPEDIGRWTSFEPDEVVIHDPDETGEPDRWISARRNAYLPIEELR